MLNMSVLCCSARPYRGHHASLCSSNTHSPPNGSDSTLCVSCNYRHKATSNVCTVFVPVEITASEFVHHTTWFCIKYCTLEITRNIQSLVEIPERKRTLSRHRSRWEDSIKMHPGIGYGGVSWAMHKPVPQKKNDTRSDITTTHRLCTYSIVSKIEGGRGLVPRLDQWTEEIVQTVH